MVLVMDCPLAALAGPWEVGGTGIDTGYKFKFELGYKDTAAQTNWVRPDLGFAAPLNSKLSYEIAVGRMRVTREGAADADLFFGLSVASALKRDRSRHGFQLPVMLSN